MAADTLREEIEVLARSVGIENPGGSLWGIVSDIRQRVEAMQEMAQTAQSAGYVAEKFELVRWSDIAEGNHVWSMGQVCVITRAAFRNDDEYDQGMNPGIMRFGHRDETGNEFAPPMELDHRVPRLIPPARRTGEAAVLARLNADGEQFRREFAELDEAGFMERVMAKLGLDIPVEAVPEVTFVIDTINDGVAIEVGGKQVWWESTFSSVDQWLRDNPLLGKLVTLEFRVAEDVDGG